MSYQAIYDAVRSQISGGDIGAAVESVLRAENIGHYATMAAESIRAAAGEYERPSVLFRPRIYVDGDKWCALYGDDLQSGVAGFGDSPAEAMANFDAHWFAKRKVPQATGEQS